MMSMAKSQILHTGVRKRMLRRVSLALPRVGEPPGVEFLSVLVEFRLAVHAPNGRGDHRPLGDKRTVREREVIHRKTDEADCRRG